MSHPDIRTRIKRKNLAFILLAPALLVPFWSCDDEGDNTEIGNGGTSSGGRGGTSSGGRGGSAGSAQNGGSGGMAGSGMGGTAMNGGSGGGTGGTTVIDPDGGIGDGGVEGCALPGDDGGIDITNCCAAMCTAQAALGCANVDPNCATGCATQQPTGCEAQWQAYVACFGNEPTSSHLCFPDQASGAPQQQIANQSVATNVFGDALTVYAHGCAAEECAFYECVAGPGVCP